MRETDYTIRLSFEPKPTSGRCLDWECWVDGDEEAGIEHGATAAEALRGMADRIEADHDRQHRDWLPATAYDCVDCGRPARDWDHRDYRKPLEVEPTCHSCNKKRGPALPYRLDQ